MRVGLETVTSSAEETELLGERLGAVLRAGDVVALTGDLGAGKTTFVHGAARGLGYDGPVTSPTFTLVKEYEGGRLPIYHLDIYRLERMQDVIDLGFEELVDRGAVVFVEWGDAIEALLPPDHLQVDLTMPPEGDTRRLEITWYGPSWSDRVEELDVMVHGWRP
jgi:tRNA threonylcarbamoyladenosine biosynthesis protein TsaE